MVMLKKFLGAGLGWAFGGPIGGILGWWLAGKLDRKQNAQTYFERSPHSKSTSSDFMVATLILASEVMKADRKIVKSEIEFVKKFLLKHFPPSSVQEMMLFLKEIQDKSYSLNEICEQINGNMNLEERIHILHFLFSISKADGEVHPSEIKMLDEIAYFLKVPADLVNSIKAMYLRSGANTIEQAYEILGVSPKDNAETIKKRFRSLSLKYHPDRVAHLGEEIKKNAEEKFKKISDAYEMIRRDKKF